MTREVDEWIGKTDDSVPPPRVRLRVFDRCGGRCHISGRKIRPGDRWEMDHVIALCNGGENRESNLAPAIYEEHRQKTAADVKQKAKDASVRARHLGIKPKSRRAVPGSKDSPWKRKVNGTTVRRDAE